MDDRAEFEANRAAGLKARHETRVERALIDQIAKAIDPDAFDETKKRSKHPAAVIQWDARKFMARQSAEKVMRPIAEAVDLCWKATQFGETEDGDTAAYIVPKGVVHRLVGALQGIGVAASLRAIQLPPKCDCPHPAVTGHGNDCPIHGATYRKIRGIGETS